MEVGRKKNTTVSSKGVFAIAGSVLMMMMMMMIGCVCQADGDAIAGSVLRNNATTRQGLLLIPTT